MNLFKILFSLSHFVELLVAVAWIAYTIYLFSQDGWVTLYYSMLFLCIFYVIHSLVGLIVFQPIGFRMIIWIILHMVIVLVTVALFLFNTFYQKEGIEHIINRIEGGDTENAYKMHDFLRDNQTIVSIVLGSLCIGFLLVFLLAGLMGARIYYARKQTGASRDEAAAAIA